MGYAVALSACFGCGQVFPYNPVHVPSITVRGVRQPICPACVERANPLRVANGLHPIVPHPEAYEPCEDGELG